MADPVTHGTPASNILERAGHVLPESQALPKATPERLATIADAMETVRDSKERAKHPLWQRVLTNAIPASMVGAFGLGAKAGLVSHAAGSPIGQMERSSGRGAALGGAIGLGAGASLEVLDSLLQNRKNQRAQGILKRAPESVKTKLADPEIDQAATDYAGARRAPTRWAELGTFLGGLGGSAYGIGSASPIEGEPTVTVPGLGIPLRSSQLHNFGKWGLIAGVGGGAAGLLAALLWRNHKRRQLVNTLGQKTAAAMQVAKVPWVTLADGTHVVLVDGEAIRNARGEHADFIGGGNHSAYSYVPAKEIWIDTEVPPEDRPFILAHEIYEQTLMQQHGWTYDRAHDAANHLESGLRHHAQAGLQKQADIDQAVGGARLGTALGAGIGALGSGLASRWLMSGAIPKNDPLKYKKVMALAKKYLSGQKVVHQQHFGAGQTDAAYERRDENGKPIHVIHSGKNPSGSVIAHELGHAMDSPIEGHFLHRLFRGVGPIAGVAGAGALGLGLAAGIPQMTALGAGVGGLGLGGYFATLLEEARASRNAHRIAAENKLPAPTGLAPAWGTYALGILPPIAAGLGSYVGATLGKNAADKTAQNMYEADNKVTLSKIVRGLQAPTDKPDQHEEPPGWPERNTPVNPQPVGGWPRKASNKAMMRGKSVTPERYSGGRHSVLHPHEGQKNAADAGESAETAPKLRSRAETVVYNADGVLAIKKDGYLLMPGGGIDDGETPEFAAYRECIEEADRKLLHIKALGVAEAVWPDDKILVDGFDGERSYFFLALDGGFLGTEHADNEPFRTIGFDEALDFLTRCMAKPENKWAAECNTIRKQAIEEAKAAASNGFVHAVKLATNATVGLVDGAVSIDIGKIIDDLAKGKDKVDRAQAKTDARPRPKLATDMWAGSGSHVRQDPPSPADLMDGPRLADNAGHGNPAEPTDPAAAAKTERPQVLTGQVDHSAAVHGYDSTADEADQGKHLPQPQVNKEAAVSESVIGRLFKQADVVHTVPRSEYVLFNPQDQVYAAPDQNRRYNFPTQGTGKKAPYEPTLRYLPPGGAPEPGVHGYDVTMNVGEVDPAAAPAFQGGQWLPPETVLKNLYASMGLKQNAPYRDIDRARARVILNYLKRKRKVKPSAGHGIPTIPSIVQNLQPGP